ncbi:MAG: hypothetical protein QXM46_02450 [Candidatus Hadarchaeales archaeon]
MDERGAMDIPIKLVIALAVGAISMGVLTQFVNVSERMVWRDMRVLLSYRGGGSLQVSIFDAETGQPLNGATVEVRYPGGMKLHTLGSSSSSYTFRLPTSGTPYLATVRVTHQGYLPWESQVAVE